jgi:hypothetical protein
LTSAQTHFNIYFLIDKHRGKIMAHRAYTSHAHTIEECYFGAGGPAASAGFVAVTVTGAGASAVGPFTAAIKPPLTPEQRELLEFRTGLEKAILGSRFVHGAYTSPFQTLEACGGAVLTPEEQKTIDDLCEIKRQELAIKYSTATAMAAEDAPAPPGP